MSTNCGYKSNDMACDMVAMRKFFRMFHTKLIRNQSRCFTFFYIADIIPEIYKKLIYRGKIILQVQYSQGDIGFK